MSGDIEPRFVVMFLEISSTFTRNEPLALLAQLTCFQHRFMNGIVERRVVMDKREQYIDMLIIQDPLYRRGRVIRRT